MRCPVCNSKLKCQDSRPFSEFITDREYICLKCKTVYVSRELLDTKASWKKPQKSALRRFGESK